MNRHSFRTEVNIPSSLSVDPEPEIDQKCVPGLSKKRVMGLVAALTVIICSQGLQGQGSYANIAGTYDGTETAKIVASAAGETETETITGSNSVTVSQSGNRFQYTIKDPQSGVSITRKGKIDGNSITLDPQPIAAFKSVQGFSVTTNRVTESSGTVSEGRIEINTVGEVLGTYLIVPFRMDITSTAVLLGSVSPIGPPSISSNPADVTVQEPDAASFSVSATGSPTPTYQWQRQPGGLGGWVNLSDGGAYSNSRTRSLSISPTDIGQTGDRFRCVVQNDEGTTTSNSATLSVTEAPELPIILSHPTGSSVWEGGRVVFTVEAVEPSVLSFQWQKGGVSITGADSATLIVPSAQLSDAGLYRCKVGNVAGETLSNEAQLEVVTAGAPTIMNRSASEEVTAGESATFEVVPSGGAALTYQWLMNGAEISGATEAVYSIASTQSFHEGSLAVAVNNTEGTSTTLYPSLVVLAPADSPARVLNLSTRGMTLTGGGVMIPGFVVAGPGTKKMLIRVVGSRLGDFGVTGALADPQLELWKNISGGGSEIVASNDDWVEQAASGALDEIVSIATKTGAFSFGTDTRSAAIVAEVTAGSYGVVSRGSNDSIGVVAAEIYDADDATEGAALVNISNRGFVGVGEAAMIPGFVISDEGSKTLLIRAVGPGLAEFGVEGVLEDPILSIYQRTVEGEELILTNDNWGDNPGSELTADVSRRIGAFPLVEESLDAAFVVTLKPGVYSAICKGAEGATGTALVEVYVIGEGDG